MGFYMMLLSLITCPIIELFYSSANGLIQMQKRKEYIKIITLLALMQANFGLRMTHLY